MGKFSTYFLMEAADVIDYIQEKTQFFKQDEVLNCQEIGDGNLNYVFRISNNSGASVIVKHSGKETRAKSGRFIDVDRNRIEAEILIHQEKLAPGLVPKVYDYDPIMCCCIMEDLKEFEILRSALLQYKIFPYFAEQISDYLVSILLPTTDVCLNHKKKKALVKKYSNPDLCEISEQLVYTESLLNSSGKNSCINIMEKFVQKEIYEDKKLHLEGAKLKFDFMEHAQSLLHGDLHSGSIFASEVKIKVFDPEFAFYGPMGYDIGNVIAHLIFALIHSEATQTDIPSKKHFRDWINETIRSIIDMFSKKFKESFYCIVEDELSKTEGFMEYYLEGILSDAAGTCGMELIRRIVGVAKVKEITNLTDETLRSYWEKRLIHLGKKFIFDRAIIMEGSTYQKYIEEALF